ncbi:MAG: PAS domain-containing protein [Nitrospiria bacterium]
MAGPLTPQDSDSKLTNIIERMTDAFVALDANWYYTYVNRKAAEIFGRKPENLIGKHIWTEFPEGTGQLFYKTYHKAMATQQFLQIEEYYPPYDRWFENRIYPSPDGLSIFFHDITERKRLNLCQEIQHRVMWLIVNGGTVSQVLNTLILEIEAQTREMICSIVLLKSDSQTLRHEAAPNLPEEYNQAINGVKIGPSAGSCGTAIHRGERVIVTDIASDPLWANYREIALKHHLRACWSEPIRFSNGEVAGSFAMYYPTVKTPGTWDLYLIEKAAWLAAITIERGRTEKLLADREEHLRTIIEAEPDCVTLVSAEGRLLQINPAGLAMIEADSIDQVKGESIYSVVDPVYQTPFKTFTEKIFLGESGQLQFAIRGIKGGRRWVETHAVPLRNAKGEIISFLGLTRDITERKRAEEALRKAHDELEAKVEERTRELSEANFKLKELDRLKSEFLATMSHELRTPLNSIIGFLGIALQGIPGPLNDEQRKQLSMAYGSARHLLGLINDILDLSRIESGRVDTEFNSVEIETVVSEVIHSLEPLASGKGLRLLTEIAGDLPAVETDRKKIYQVLLNLVNNAVKFTHRGEIKIECKVHHDQLEIQVSDTGIGIKKENMDHLFEAFQQLDGGWTRRYQGTGLGLYLCKKLMNLLGGQIRAESEFDKGSRFTVILPVKHKSGIVP